MIFPLLSAAQLGTNVCPSLAKTQLDVFSYYQINFLPDFTQLYNF